MNLRQGQFHERPLPPGFSSVKAMAVADANNDGILDLLAVQADGAIIRISDKNEGQSWETAEIAKVPDTGSVSCGRCASARRRSRQQRGPRSVSFAHYLDPG